MLAKMSPLQYRDVCMSHVPNSRTQRSLTPSVPLLSGTKSPQDRHGSLRAEPIPSSSQPGRPSYLHPRPVFLRGHLVSGICGVEVLAPELVPHGPQVLCKHHAAPGLHEQGRVSPGLRMNEQSRVHYLPPAPSFPQAAIGKAPQPSQLGHFVLLAACTTTTYRASG